MLLDTTRRGAITGAAAVLTAGPAALAAVDRFTALEQSVGGRLGVAALDTGSGQRLAHRAGERFAMCSTFKVLAVSALLARVDRGVEQLTRAIPYGEADLLEYAPVTRAHVMEGALPLLDLCAAAIEVSDNTAANLILKELGGPAAVTAFVRTLGDPVTRLDRNEPSLNSAEPGDARDTTTPAAMIGDLRALLLGGVLAPASRDRLKTWMIACSTGTARLRAGFPPTWQVGDKTGSGALNTGNDIAVVWAPGAPILIASYLTTAKSDAASRDAVHAGVARIVAETFRHG